MTLADVETYVATVDSSERAGLQDRLRELVAVVGPDGEVDLWQRVGPTGG